MVTDESDANAIELTWRNESRCGSLFMERITLTRTSSMLPSLARSQTSQTLAFRCSSGTRSSRQHARKVP